jgi:hypothetical protein
LVRRKGPYTWEKALTVITKGWVYGVTEKNSDWLGSSTGPHTKEVWTKLELGCATRL